MRFVQARYDEVIRGLADYNNHQNIYNIEIFLKNLEEKGIS